MHVSIYRCVSLKLFSVFIVYFMVCVCFLCPQAALRQKELEKSIQWAQENDKTLRQMQEALANTDRHLTSYLTDHIDAQQIPQEAQVDQCGPKLFPLFHHHTLSHVRMCC